MIRLRYRLKLFAVFMWTARKLFPVSYWHPASEEGTHAYFFADTERDMNIAARNYVETLDAHPEGLYKEEPINNETS